MHGLLRSLRSCRGSNGTSARRDSSTARAALGQVKGLRCRESERAAGSKASSSLGREVACSVCVERSDDEVGEAGS
jgi:hypothetical protein